MYICTRSRDFDIHLLLIVLYLIPIKTKNVFLYVLPSHGSKFQMSSTILVKLERIKPTFHGLFTTENS